MHTIPLVGSFEFNVCHMSMSMLIFCFFDCYFSEFDSTRITTISILYFSLYVMSFVIAFPKSKLHEMHSYILKISQTDGSKLQKSKPNR